MTQPDQPTGIFTVIFWKKATERMVRAFAASLVSVFTLGATGAISIDWKKQLLAAALTAAGSLVFSLAGTQFGDPNDPSLIKPKE